MEPLLGIEDLAVSFRADEGRVRAVDHVSLAIQPGEVLGLVGESGCGKSVLCLSVLRLIPSPPGQIDAGRVLFHGRDLLSLPVAELRKIRGHSISMIFQEPAVALSPLHRIGEQMVESFQFHRRIGRSDARQQAETWLRRVGLPDAAECMHAYPFQLSGGMLQRVMIAMALMLEPELVIADEPTTALDVTIQAQIFDLMRAVKKEETSMLLVTHDMAVVWEMCTRVAVMYAAEIFETGPVQSIFTAPLHPYTEALLESVRSLSEREKKLQAIPGQVPSPLAYPECCRFADRCRYCFDRCLKDHPKLKDKGAHQVRCFLRE